jgi:hypothetical protein
MSEAAGMRSCPDAAMVIARDLFRLAGWPAPSGKRETDRVP